MRFLYQNLQGCLTGPGCLTVSGMGLLPDTKIIGLRMRRGWRERFPRQLMLAIPTYITAHAWRTCREACRDRELAVSFEVGGGGNVLGIPGACATRDFRYLVRYPFWAPCQHKDRFTDIEIPILKIRLSFLYNDNHILLRQCLYMEPPPPDPRSPLIHVKECNTPLPNHVKVTASYLEIGRTPVNFIYHDGCLMFKRVVGILLHEEVPGL